MGYPAKFGSLVNASEFAYGVNKTTPALIVVNGPNTTVGAQAQQLAFGYTQTNDGIVFFPLNTNAPIAIGGASATETVTPSSVSNSTPTVFSSSSVTATFASLHGNGDSIRSGTAGLQEALNYTGSIGGGTVIIDPTWVQLGGTQAMLVAATVPANVGIWDNRFGADISSFQATLTSTQILNMATTAVQILPTPGLLQYWNVNSANLINLASTTAYVGGSSVTIGYGTTLATNALSGTIANTFITAATSQVIQVGSGLTSATAATAVLGKGIYINNATTSFTTGNGTLQIDLNAALITV